jgi:hypothetical protein
VQSAPNTDKRRLAIVGTGQPVDILALLEEG